MSSRLQQAPLGASGPLTPDHAPARPQAMPQPARRLTILTKTFPKLSETFILQEFLGLERLGFDLDIVSLQHPTDAIQHAANAELGASVSYLVPAGIGDHVRAVSAHLGLMLLHPLRYSRALKEAKRLEPEGRWPLFAAAGRLAWRLTLGRARHLHVHFASTPADVALLVSTMSGVPFSLSAHAKDIYLSKPSDLRRKLDAARFTVTCTGYNRDVLERIAGPDAIIQRAYHGLGTAAFTPPERSPSATGMPPLILSVGRLRPKKGFATLIEACALLRDQGRAFRCTIVGYGPDEEELRRQIERHGLGDHIALPGKMGHDQLIQLYRDASQFVLPARIDEDGDRDGLPNVLLEAMAMALPVVSTAISGIPEAVIDGENGFLISPDDPVALAEKIGRLLDHPDEAAAFGRRGRKLVEAKFEPAANLRPLTDLLADAGIVPAQRLDPGDAEIAYVLKGFPRFSEPFIANEIHLLERQGFRLRLYSIKQGDHDRPQPVIARINAPLTTLPTVSSVSQTPLITWLRDNLRKFTSSHRELIGKRPGVWLATLASAIAMGFRYRKGRIGGFRKVFIKEFLQAGIIANDILKRPEVVHLHGHFCHGATTVTWFASRLTGLPFSFTAHAKDIYQGKLNPSDLLPRKLEASRFAVTCTEANKQHLDNLVDAANQARPVHRIYHGLDLERFAPSPRGPWGEEPVILGVGRLTRKKGFPTLIEALAQLHASGQRFRLRLIGEDGDDADEIQRRIGTSGFERRIEMAGAVPQDQLRAAYQDADLFVLPCRVVEDGDRDGIPNVLAEAMAMELPVVSTTVSGIPEIVRDGDNGLLVAPDDAIGLAGAIGRLLDDPLLARRLGVAARRTITRVFDSTVTTEDLGALFEGAIAESLRHRPVRLPVSRIQA